MEKQPDTRRIIIFLSFAFGIAWITGLIIYLTGGLVNSPQIVPGISLALILLALDVLVILLGVILFPFLWQE